MAALARFAPEGKAQSASAARNPNPGKEKAGGQKHEASPTGSRVK